MQERNRNWRFDFLKGISCVFVVFLHCRFPGVIGNLIIYAFRFPVPIFFMITGYYSYEKDRTWIFKRTLGIPSGQFFVEPYLTLPYGIYMPHFGPMGSSFFFVQQDTRDGFPPQYHLCFDGAFYDGYGIPVREAKGSVFCCSLYWPKAFHVDNICCICGVALSWSV